MPRTAKKELGFWTVLGAALGFGALLLPACGPHVETADTTTGAGGDGGATTGSTSSAGGGGAGGTMTGGGGSADKCSWKMEVLPTQVAMSALLQSAPELAPLPQSEQTLVTFINAPPGDPGALYGITAEFFGQWPPAWGASQLLDGDVSEYALSAGPNGPIGLLHHEASPPTLFDPMLPVPSLVDTPISDEGRLLFLNAIPNRYFWASAGQTPTYQVLHVGSYQPGSLTQTDDPLLCTTSPILGAAKPAGSGFVAAFTEPNPPEPGCDSQNPKPGTIVSVSVYDSPAGLGSSLVRSQGARLVTNEPVVNLGLETASFGAWVVYQTDGSTSRIPPPVTASRVGKDGLGLGQDTEMIALSPGGALSPEIATASLGDTLAVAWIDNLDPSAPLIVIQLVRPDGTLGIGTSIPTNDSWYSGHLRLLASPDNASLVVAWETAAPGPHAAFARVDCIPEP